MSKRINQYLPYFITVTFLVTFILSSFGKLSNYGPVSFKGQTIGADSNEKEPDSLKYPIPENAIDPLGKNKSHSLDLETPNIFEKKIELDTSLENYRIYNSLFDEIIGEENNVPFDEYLKESTKQYEDDYFKERAKTQNFLQGQSSRLDNFTIKTPKVIEDIIGGGIDIKPQGSAELIFSYDYNKVENPSWSLRQQRTGQFKFDQKIKLNVRGNIGDKIGLGIGYDTESSFEFDNEIKLRYEGKEDDIVKLLEAGNVSLPIKGSLISGSQSLFGFKTQLQFGRMTVTSVFSQQKSEKKEITIENGAQKTSFDISALEYDANKHFFLNQYFRDHYESALANLPVITSNIQITRIEVWVINKTNDYNDTRNIIAFADLGEVNPWNSSSSNPQKGNFVTKKSNIPDNECNTLYEILTSDNDYRLNATASKKLSALQNSPTNFYNGQDYIKIDNARKLGDNEYTIDKQLGFISLNQRLDAGYALAVAYEFTINGAVRQVGEFSQDIPPDQSAPNVLFLKMLKSTSTRIDIPMWDLMMKNVYSLGSSQIQSTDFKLDIIYEDDKSGANLNYIPESDQPALANSFLLELLGLDRLNSQNEASVDGVFDFLDGRTIISGTGKIIFPYLEPFGATLRTYFKDQTTADKYAYDAIYDSTQVQAEQLKQYDKFYLKGYYLGTSGSEISLNAINIPEGSVTVTSGGVTLRENVDYTVDYTLGRVKIINESILNSGQPIKIVAESNTLFAINQKSLFGSRFDYKFNEDFNLGSTILYLKEKPLTQKVNIGDEPMSNLMVGLDGTYRTDSRFLTKMIDKIPLIDTKEESEILLEGEFARLFPGHPNIIGSNGVSYLDDFEGSEVPYDLRTGSYWVLASTPQLQSALFPNSSYSDDLRYNYGRAKIAWYIIDDFFYTSSSNLPSSVDAEMLSKNSMREVLETEVFPNKQLPSGVPSRLSTFDLSYFPSERGPYNYDASSINSDGSLKNPASNWGGIMRKIETNDFEAANIEYIELWMMDPYADYDPGDEPDGGTIYLHLGDVSEDILRDGLKTFENGYPEDENTSEENSIKTAWGYVPSTTPVNYAFDNDPEARAYQDLGFDGLSSEQEKTFFKESFLDKLSGIDATAYSAIESDPSADAYHFFRGDDLDAAEADIIERYKYYQNPENNSPIADDDGTYESGSLSPDVEDINNDYTLNEIESYYQYGIKIRPKDDPSMQVGQNFITDRLEATVTLKNGKSEDVVWYQFKIPVRSYEKRLGQIRDFKSIRFMRLVMTDFAEPVTCRFARLQLVRGDWRRYLYSLDSPTDVYPGDESDTSSFDVSTVNIEANGYREPIPYVLPPGIEREVDYSYTELLEQNEQSLAFTACLDDGEAKAVYKNTSFDVRTYKRLKMFVHAEAAVGQELETGDLSLFIRMGTDFDENYYEYEIPLYPTDPDVGQDAEEIWKTENEIDLEFEEFYRVKQLRETETSASITVPYAKFDNYGKGKITVLGNPDLSDVKVIMIGLRNPPKDDPWNTNDLGLSKCGIVWVNELRVTDFDEEGGWAAVGKATANLADFGRITASGNITTVGFGGIEQSLQERSKEDVRGVNVQSFLELGKFFPQKAGVKIPMYYNFTNTRTTPQYNPLSPDILLETTLSLAETKEERDSILYISQTNVSRRSLNFMNVQKMRKSGGKTHFYDIENFLVSYIYSDVTSRDINTELDLEKNHQLIFNYNYSFRDKSITPLKKLSKSKYLKLLTDFNVGLLPQSFAFSSEIDRRYGEIRYRNTSDIVTIIKPIYDKNFTMSRTFDYKHNFARSLRFTYNANADAYIEEPDGPITEESKAVVRESLLSMGRKKAFDQRVGLSYDVPIKKIPFLNWVSARANYTGSYNWQEAPPTNDTIGSTIQNSRTIQLNSQLNFINLYSKVPFLKTINSGRSNIDKIRKEKFKELKAENKQKKKEGEEVEEVTEDDVKINESALNLVEGALRILMSLRTVSVSYTLNQGTILPGFSSEPQYLGNDWGLNAPGIPFILGWQDTTYKWDAARNGWLNKYSSLSSYYSQTSSENLTIQANLEPIKGFKVNVDMSRKMNNSSQGIFKYDDLEDEYIYNSPIESGSFSISYWSLPTAFKGKWDEDISEVYQAFENNRWAIAQRLSVERYGAAWVDDSTGYFYGYHGTSQQVLIPSFLAAVSNKNNQSVGLNLFPKIPAPNWRVTYNGLSRLDAVKQYAKNVNINHSYRSTYTVSNFTSSLDYDEDLIPESGENLVPEFRVQQIAISEQLSPLIGIDVTWVNNWTTNLEFRSTRNLSFSFSNYQMTELRNRDFVIGVGYRTKEFQVPFKIHGKKYVLPNDLNFRLDFTLKNSRSNITRLDSDESESVGGNSVLTLKPVVDYVVNDNLTFRFFFNRNVTKPAISTSYPTSFTNGGFSVTYTLGN